MVFRSPMADHRTVAVGALLPLAEGLTGGPRVLHTLVGAVAALGLVMVVTRGRRLVRRRWLGIPIGLFLHLVLDGTFTRAELFWWPFLGPSWSTSRLPELGRGGASLLLEVLGAAACWWGYRRFRLDEPERRAEFLRTGRVGRDIVR